LDGVKDDFSQEFSQESGKMVRHSRGPEEILQCEIKGTLVAQKCMADDLGAERWNCIFGISRFLWVQKLHFFTQSSHINRFLIRQKGGNQILLHFETTKAAFDSTV